MTCSCEAPFITGDSKTCYACLRPSPIRTRVVPIDPSFGMVDGEDDYSFPQAAETPAPGYVASVLSTVDAFVASGLKVKTVRCGFLLFAECRAKVGAKVEIGSIWFERNGVRWLYDQDLGAYGLAIGAEAT